MDERTRRVLDTQKLGVAVTQGKLGGFQFTEFPNGQGQLSHRLGRPIPRSTLIAADAGGVNLRCLGERGKGIDGGLFAQPGDTILHLLIRNRHLPNRDDLVETYLGLGGDASLTNDEDLKPWELELEGPRLVKGETASKTTTSRFPAIL